MVSESGGHCGGAFNRLGGFRGFDFERGMGAAEIEVGNLQRDGQFVIFERLGISQRLAGEPAIEQAHGEVATFTVVGGHHRAVRIADERFARHRDALDRVVPPLPRGFLTKVFDLNSVVDVFAEDFSDGTSPTGVSHVSIAGQLEPARGLVPQALHDSSGIISVAFTHAMMDNQFGGLFDGQKGVLIAAQGVVSLGVLLQATDEPEHFIDGNELSFDIIDAVFQQFTGLSSSGFEDVQNGVFAESTEPSRSPDSNTFTKHLDNLGDLGGFDANTVQGLLFGKCFSATHTTEPPNDAVYVFKTSKLLGFSATTETLHYCLSRAGGLKWPRNFSLRQLLASPPLVAACWCF
jgi:hypothetical protein